MSKVGGQRMVILAYGNPLEGTVEHGRTCSPRWATEWSPGSTWWPSRPSAPGTNWNALNRGYCIEWGSPDPASQRGCSSSRGRGAAPLA